MGSVLDETQNQRDLELQKLTSTPLKEIESYEIAAPECIKIYDGNEEPKTQSEYLALYRNYNFLNLVGYLRTLMFTSVHRRGDVLPKVLRETKNQVCLDFGSGVGTHAIALLENGNTVDTLDVFGPLWIFALHRINGRGLKVNHAFSEQSELPEDNYDLIICADVLEHVYDPMAELDRMKRALKSGGRLFLEISRMIKYSSGHFPHSIAKCQSEGIRYLGLYFNYKDGVFVKK